MTRRTVEADRRLYTVNFDEERRRGDLYQSLAFAQLVDELTEEPVRGSVRVRTAVPGAQAKTASGGIAGVAGVPARLFPKLDAQPYDVDLRFEVDGFVPLVPPDVSIPQQPGFPDAFADVDLGPLELRRLPVALIVRTMTLDPQHRLVTLSGATVDISAIWRRVADLPGAPIAADLVALRPELSAARPRPGTTFQPVTMAPVVEPERRLMRAANPGTRDLEVSRTGALAIGSVVGIDRADADRVEYVAVHDIVGPSDPESPATVILEFPVQHTHRENAVINEVTPTTLGPPTADLSAEAFAGDATVFVTSVAPFSGAPIARISGGTPPAEYVTAAPYRALTDGDGYGRLPPLTRVAAVELVATAPGPLAAPPTRFTPHYGEDENHVHLTLA